MQRQRAQQAAQLVFFDAHGRRQVRHVLRAGLERISHAQPCDCVECLAVHKGRYLEHGVSRGRQNTGLEPRRQPLQQRLPNGEERPGGELQQAVGGRRRQ